MADSPGIPDTESKRDYRKGRTLNPELPPYSRTALRAQVILEIYATVTPSPTSPNILCFIQVCILGMPGR